PSCSPLFPYTTLFRSIGDRRGEQRRVLLHPEALQERRAGDDRAARGGASEPSAGEQDSQGRRKAARQVGKTGGVEQDVARRAPRSEEHTSELQSLAYL